MVFGAFSKLAGGEIFFCHPFFLFPFFLAGGGEAEWFLGAFAKLQKANISFVMPFCLSAKKGSVPTGRIFIKFPI